jgi:hypothetical protein
MFNGQLRSGIDFCIHLDIEHWILFIGYSVAPVFTRCLFASLPFCLALLLIPHQLSHLQAYHCAFFIGNKIIDNGAAIRCGIFKTERTDRL